MRPAACAALIEAAVAFRAASGLPRGRIAGGEAAEVFAPADLGHPRALSWMRGVPLVLFARDRLCALARPGPA